MGMKECFVGFCTAEITVHINMFKAICSEVVQRPTCATRSFGQCGPLNFLCTAEGAIKFLGIQIVETLLLSR